MRQGFLQWVLRVFPDSSPFYSYYGNCSDVSFLKNWFEHTTKKIRSDPRNETYEILDFKHYEEYFKVLKSMGLQSEFEIISSKDKVLIKGSFIKSFFVNSKNKNKVIIFCHGVSNNRWSLFYQIYLALQLGYSVVTYDARNHGFSGKSYTTLGLVESNDLEDVVKWSLQNTAPSSLGMYGFSMGASTVLYWIGKFQNEHQEVKAVFCESPFDDFAKRFDRFLKNDKTPHNLEDVFTSSEIEKSTVNKSNFFLKIKNNFFYNLVTKILKTPLSLYGVKPVDFLPDVLKLNLLLIHGLEDNIIDYNSSIEIWKKLLNNKNNIKKMKFFLVENAGHGDLFFFSDFVKKKILSYDDKKRRQDLTFFSIFHSFFNESL